MFSFRHDLKSFLNDQALLEAPALRLRDSPSMRYAGTTGSSPGKTQQTQLRPMSLNETLSYLEKIVKSKEQVRYVRT